MLEMGFRDDIDAIMNHLPKKPELQITLSTATVPLAVNHTIERLLSPDRKLIKTLDEVDVAQSRVPQWHTIVPSAGDLFPHVLRLLAKTQLSTNQYKKTLVYCPTTRMAQLVSTLLRALVPKVLPAGEDTEVFEVHGMIAGEKRTNTLTDFRRTDDKHAILVTTDLVARAPDVGKASHVIQIGIPSSSSAYFDRVARVGEGRSDLVLLPWEIGFMTWQLTEADIKPFTRDELKREVAELATNRDATLGSGEADAHTAPVLPVVESINHQVEELKKLLDEDAIKETFASLLGYYIPKSPEVRCQKPIIVQGLKDWTTEACGLPAAPYVSDAFLNRLGMYDGRTKHFGQKFVMETRKSNDVRWSGRGRQSTRGYEKELPDWARENEALDERDPVTSPEDYRTARYGKADHAVKRTLGDRPPPKMSWDDEDASGGRVNARQPQRIRTWGGESSSSRGNASPPSPRVPTFVREQERIRNELTEQEDAGLEFSDKAKAARASLAGWGSNLPDSPPPSSSSTRQRPPEPQDPWQLPPAKRTTGSRSTLR